MLPSMTPIRELLQPSSFMDSEIRVVTLASRQ